MTTTNDGTAAASPFSMESLVGPKLLTKVGQPLKDTKKIMDGKELVLLYFSASWCPPCQSFSPLLIDFYNQTTKDGKLEIIYISSDRTVPDFEGYYSKMPWTAISSDQGNATIKSNLAQLLHISGIPMLIVLDAKTGDFVSAKAREDVTSAVNSKGGKSKMMELVKEWKTTQRVPISEAAKLLGGGEKTLLQSIISFFAKNPMMIFALFYSYKWIMKNVINKYTGGGEGGAATTIEDDVAAADLVPDEPADTEF